eukprot:COSAG04_NODE_1479_length_6568_cov_94.314886_2_plen_362_part_00
MYDALPEDLLRVIACMKFGDVMTTILIACCVAIAAARELDDITVCQLMRKPMMRNPKEWDWFQLPLSLLEALRHFVLLPLITKTIPWLVLYQGGDALSICLNAVALLFILECDDFIFCILSEQTQSEMLSKKGHYQLRKKDVQLLTTSKRVHTLLVIVAIPFTFLQYRFGEGRQHRDYITEQSGEDYEDHWHRPLDVLERRGGIHHGEFGETDWQVEMFARSDYVEHMSYIYLLGAVITTSVVAFLRLTKASTDAKEWFQENGSHLKEAAISTVQICLQWYIGWWIIDYWLVFIFYLNHTTADTDYGWDSGITYAVCTQAQWDADTTTAQCEVAKTPEDIAACHLLHGPDALCSVEEGHGL